MHHHFFRQIFVKKNVRKADEDRRTFTAKHPRKCAVVELNSSCDENVLKVKIDFFSKYIELTIEENLNMDFNNNE
jgi:hypothetical protein